MDSVTERTYVRGGRLYNIELLRFVGMILIMGHHLYHIGFEGNYICRNCWVWVDFYFIITGAFTYKHFFMSHGEKCEDRALVYTGRKFKKFFVYTTVAVLFQYCIDNYSNYFCGGIKSFIKGFIYAPYEILYLSSSGLCTPHVAPIWFLSAMIIVLPLMIYFMKVLPEFWEVFAFIFPILYFGYKGVNTDRTWPNDMIRACACMALGTIVYILAEYIAVYCGKKILCRVMFSSLEIICLIVAIYVPMMNKEYINIMELLFFVLCTLMMSGVTYSSDLNGVIFKWLGKMSMPMFIFHWGVGSIVCFITNDLKCRIWFYYIGTFLAAFVAIIISMFLKQNRNTR